MHLLEGTLIDACLFGTKYTYVVSIWHMLIKIIWMTVIRCWKHHFEEKVFVFSFSEARFSHFSASYFTIIDLIKLISSLNTSAAFQVNRLFTRYYQQKTSHVGMQRNFSSAQEGLSSFQWTECETGAFNSRQIYLYTNTHKEYCTNYLTNLGMRMRAAWDFGSGFSALSRKQRTISHLERAAQIPNDSRSRFHSLLFVVLFKCVCLLVPV